MTYLEHTSFDKQKKISEKHPVFKDSSRDIISAVLVRRRLIETLYAQQYSPAFGVYYDIVDPIVRFTKKKLIYLKKNSKKLSIKSQLSTLIKFFYLILYCKIYSSVRPFECCNLNVYHVMGSW